jgi:hypothetical protein
VRTPEEFGVVPETSEEKVRGGETVEAFERINASEDGAYYTPAKLRA